MLNSTLYKCFLAVASLALITGCTDKQGTNTLYLDSVTIAKALGRTEVIAQQQESARLSLNTQLERITAALNEKLGDEREKYGESPSEEEQKTLDSLTVQANKQLQQTQLLARQKLANFQQQLLTSFKNELILAAKPIARERNSDSVVIINSDILWYQPSADITDEVIANIRTKSAEVKPSPTPATLPQVVPTDNPPSEAEKLNNLVDEIKSQDK